MTPWQPDVENERAIWAVLATLVQDVADLRERLTRLEESGTD